MQLIRQEFDGLADGQGNLSGSLGSPSYFAGWPWACVQMTHCRDPGDEVSVLALQEEGGAPNLLLPVRHPARARYLRGARELAAFNTPYSTIWSPVAAAGIDQAATANALAGGIRAACPGADYVVFEALAAEGAWLAQLRRAFAGAGYLLHEFVHFGNWYRPTAGMTWPELRAELPAQLRNTLDRKGRRLAAGHRSHLALFASPDEARSARQAYETVHARSWKVAEPYSDFIGALIESAAGAGALRLGLLEIDGEPAAAQIWIVSGGTATIFKLAHDERWKTLSPGSLLTAWMMEQILQADRPTEIDFGRGDDAYKKDWLPLRRERRGLIAFDPRRPLGLVGAVGERVRSKLRPIVARLQRTNQASG